MNAFLAAFSFDPNVRGILVVLVGVTVLMGSVFLLLATNSGARTGFLIAGAGLFGWCFLMGNIWWMYGIGLKGRDPAWVAHEINYDRSSEVATDVVTKLPAPEKLPSADSVIGKYPLLRAIAIANEGKTDWAPANLTDLVTLATPLVTIKPDDAAKAAAKLSGEFNDVIKDDADVSGVVASSTAKFEAAVHREAAAMRDEIEKPLGGWCLLAASDSRRGDAVAASDAALAAGKVFGESTTSANYIVHDVFFYGGKEPCYPNTERSTLSQAWHRIATTFEVKNPPLYSVVTLTKALEQVTVDGQAPPTPKVEPGASTVSVIMERNLGNRRWPPFVFTVATGIMFALFAWQLHHRDKVAMANRAAAEKS